MNGKKVVTIVEETITPIIVNLGYDLVDVEYVKQVDGYHLIVTIDKAGGVGIDDCETVHRAIDQVLDDVNPTNDSPYVLQVSSCGLDRPLKKPSDYNRNLNKEIRIKLYAPNKNGQKEIVGVLVSFDEKTVTINGKEIVTIDKEKIALAEPVIKF